ncbi:MAG: hypothetical protein FWG10_05235 [Eubacteriaceae bacterium]|nr:hypothetical protein [Eubacteriaceae bacterium]
MKWQVNSLHNVSIKADYIEDALCFFAEGSIKGFSVKNYKKRQMKLRLEDLANGYDAQIASDFLQFTSKHYLGKIYGKHGERINLDEGEFLIANYLEDLAGFIEASLDKNKEATFGLFDAQFKIHPDEYLRLKSSSEFPENLKDYLQQKATKLFNARRAGNIQIANGMAVSIWSFDDMIVQPRDLVAIKSPTDDKDVVIVEWSDFIGSLLVPYEVVALNGVDECSYLVSGVDESQAAKIIEEFKKTAIDPGLFFGT